MDSIERHSTYAHEYFVSPGYLPVLRKSGQGISTAVKVTEEKINNLLQNSMQPFSH